ncbi:MAG: alpha/beta hydrolase [Gammaproteobacteria bacterium]
MAVELEHVVLTCPENPLAGIVLLHGASESPYSMRALADVFFAAGLYVIAVRLPGHGTIPGELTAVRPEDWQAIVPMAVAHVGERIGNDKPIHLGGYSAGAAVVLNYALLETRALEFCRACNQSLSQN